LTVAEAVTRCAIERRESRGAQFRDDYPTKTDEGATYNTAVRRGPDGSMQLRRIPVTPMREDLKQVVESQK
jgi:succinate dehydrogenase / fumarate reductase, flavoprotein subunit